MNILIFYDISNPHRGGIENVSWRLGCEFESLGHKVYYIFKWDKLINNRPIDESQRVKNQLYIPNDAMWDCAENREYFISVLEELQIDIILNQAPEVREIFEFVDSIPFVSNKMNVKLLSVHHFNPYLRIREVEDVILHREDEWSLFMREYLGCNPIAWAKSLSLWLLYKIYRFDKFVKNEVRLNSFIYDKSDALVLLSEKFEAPFRSLIGRESTDKLYSITNPVTIPKERVTVRDKEKIILYVGRLVRSLKRADRLLMIWKRLYKRHPDWRLVIVGDGSHRTTFEEMARKHKLERVEFEGQQIPDEYYKRASILPLTSTAEGFGLVLVEAQQAGCIPFAFNSFESVTDIITDGEDGFLVAPFNLDAYAEKLSELMSNDDLRASIANNCLAKDYSKFDVRNVAPRWIELFENLMKR